MSSYFSNPFPFHKIINKDAPVKKIDLDDSIRGHLRSLILMRIGEFAYDRNMGFEMWEYDKEVFFHENAPYYEHKKTKKGVMENSTARKQFKENLEQLIKENEIRLEVENVQFGFEKVGGNLSVYQRKINIKVSGRIKSTGERLTPAFEMKILFTPFKIETN